MYDISLVGKGGGRQLIHEQLFEKKQIDRKKMYV